MSGSSARKNIEDIYPLTPAQQGMLFHAVQAPDSGVYIEQLTAHLPADLDPERLRGAWDRITSRHPVLRTLFVVDRGKQPLQIVRRQVTAPWRDEDWRAFSDVEATERLTLLLHQDRRAGFTLDRAPLMRFCLIAWPGAGWRFVWTFHHLLLDGWSTAQVLGEVRAAYDGVDLQSSPPAPFRTFVSWLGQQDGAAAERYWREVFRGFSGTRSLLPLWSDATNSQEPGAYRHNHLELTQERIAALQAFARSARVTPNTVFQGAWACLLARYSGDADLVFGVTVSGRPADLPGAESMVGMFINTLPVRVRVPEQASIVEWLQALQSAQTEARRYEFSALSDVQRWSGVASDIGLFDTLLVFESYPVKQTGDGSPLRFDGLEFHEQSNFALSLLVVPGEPWRLLLISDPARVSQRIVEQWLESLDQILTSMVDRNARNVGDVDACSPAQLAMLADWSRGPEVQPTGPSTVVEAIGACFRRYPDRTALVADNESVDYAQLRTDVVGLAAALRRAGVAPGQVVPVFGPRDIRTITALLAVQAAGAAYLPLDASYPNARIVEILRAIPADLLGTERIGLAIRPPSGSLLEMDLNWLAPDPEPIDGNGNEFAEVSANDLAYLIFTSGSTGGPKGVPVSHRNLAWSTQARVIHYGGSPQRFLLLSPLAFDSSVAGLFWTLTGGGTLVLPTPEQMANPAALAELLLREHITHLLCLPSLWAVLLDALPKGGETSLAQVIVAGESCPSDLVRKHKQVLPGVRLENEYGPTEATVWCTAQRLDEVDWETVVPIGRPLPGVRVQVRDLAGRQVPPGGLGELRVGGPGLVDGYLNAPELSARVFNNAGDSLGRNYRTGDFVRYVSDGSLMFMGRADDQIKVRGHRVEPRQVEAVLAAHPGVRDCAVTLNPGGQLWALIQTAEGADRGFDGLHDWLRDRLPSYQIPDRIECVSVLPRLPSGKLDRRQLGGLMETAISAGPVWTPGDTAEGALARIWQDLLGAPPHGPDADFFQSGGHSLLSMRLLVDLERRLGVRVSLADFLANPTPRGLIERVRAGEAISQWQSMVPVKPSGSRAPFFCVHGDPTALGPHLHPETPYYWLHHAQGGGNVSYATVESLAGDHLAEIRSIQPNGPYRLAGYSFGGLIAFEMARQLESVGESVSFLGLIEPTLVKAGTPSETTLGGADEAETDPVLRAFARRARSLKGRALRKLRMEWCEHYVRSGRTMPAELRDFHMVQLFAQAGRAYAYPRYGGSAVLFVSADTAAHSDRIDDLVTHWRGVCAGGVDLVAAEGVASHTDLFREPQVAALADLIERRLT